MENNQQFKGKNRLIMKSTFFGIFFVGTCFAEPQLQLINIVFRHGDRTPVLHAIFPTDPYHNSSFYPYGHGGLTNDGKYRIYKFGEFLRRRYKDFLGDVYLPNLIYVRSTDVDRTKMSAQLVLAALFPPSDLQKWHDTLDWQPIPITYYPKPLDVILAVTSQSSYLRIDEPTINSLSLSFIRAKKRVSKTEYIRNRLKHFEAFISQLEKLTGMKIKETYDVTKIYDTLYCEWKMNLTLPSWTNEIFPNGKLLDAALIDYELMTYDQNMTYDLVGKLAEKIREDILAVTNTRETIERKKLYLYSGHEVNVVGALMSLQIYDRDHIPTYGSAVIIELLKENDKYYVKVLYYKGNSSKVEEMALPGCSILCPLEHYLTLVYDLLGPAKALRL
ncbi:venom acid phosphatase Acph-1-like [Phymastichus coffea]|uniref:venom acid phosphatase Acph-1-like n=1 Tax=Phymastichus coffea TaxID=108790 RepID=UPI00273B401E|nr:venom acid phosphatase Acph-1-like [Phymastichus coffea]